jgi:hypothetical protein
MAWYTDALEPLIKPLVNAVVGLFAAKRGEPGAALRPWSSKRAQHLSPDNFSTVDVSADYTTAADVNFKSKIRIIMRNDTGQTVNIHNPIWIADGNVRLDLPRRLKLQVELVEGDGRSNKWSEELDEVQVPPRWVFRTWIGLHSPLSNTDFRRIRQNRQFGTLSLAIRGYDYKIKIPV